MKLWAQWTKYIFNHPNREEKRHICHLLACFGRNIGWWIETNINTLKRRSRTSSLEWYMMFLHSIPSISYSRCSLGNIYSIKYCCSLSLETLIRNWSKPLILKFSNPDRSSRLMDGPLVKLSSYKIVLTFKWMRKDMSNWGNNHLLLFILYSS